MTLAPLALSALLAGPAHAATAEEMAISMEIPAADVVSATMMGGATAYDVLPNVGIINPTVGADAAYLFTGQIGTLPQTGYDHPPLNSPNGDDTRLQLELQVPAFANSFRFDFYFLSAEYPEFVGTIYNDKFEANIAGSAWTGNAAIDSVGNQVSINSVLFTVVNPADLSGTGYEGNRGGGTGWLSVVVPATAGEVLSLELRVYDQSDGIYDSSVYLDGFEWSESIVLDPFIVEKIDILYLTPKTGSIEGGDTVSVVGAKFNDSCVASLDGVEALSTTFVDNEHLEIVTPAHAEGLVDVSVSCIGTDDRLIGGYTYYDQDAGELPPVIEAVDPYTVSTEGGERITVFGVDFNDGAVVAIDGVDVETLYVDNETLQAVTQPHSPGPVNLGVTNPSGLADLRVGALVFEEPDEDPDPPDDTGAVPDDTGGTKDDGRVGSSATGCGCDGSGGVASAAWLGLLALAARRRRSS